MNDFPANENNEPENVSEEFSTIFSDPSQKNDNVKAKDSGRLKKVIVALCLVVALIIGTFAVVKLIPVPEDDEPSSSDSKISAVNVGTKDIKTLTLTNPNGTFKFYSQTKEEISADGKETSEVVVWCVDGIDSALTSSSKIASIIAKAANISAISEITGRTNEECGLNEPLYLISFDTKDESYTIKLGTHSPDNLGIYISVNDKIYLVDAALIEELDFGLLDLAEASNLKGIEITDEIAEYVSKEDASRIESFDELTVSGVNFKKPLVINMKELAEDEISYSNYVLASHGSRQADNTAVGTVFSFFAESVSLSGAYSFENTAAAQKAVGLDKPYITIGIKLGSVSRTYKIAKVDENSCAVVTDSSVMIYRAPHSSIPFLEYTEEDFYGKMVYMEHIKNVSSVGVASNGEDYTFEVTYNEEQEEKLTANYNGEKLDTEKFQNMYTCLIGLEYTDFSVTQKNAEPEITVTLKLTDNTTNTIKLFKDSATRYTCSVNGQIYGRVSSSQADKLLKAARELTK